MQRFLPLLLEVWQQACRDIHIDRSAPAIAAVLARRLPLQRLLLYQLDPERDCLRCLARVQVSASVVLESAGIESELTREAFRRIARWCDRRGVIRGSTDALERDLPGLRLSDLAGSLMAGGLVSEGVSEGGSEGAGLGVVVLQAADTADFDETHEPLLAALLDPLGVAMQNDRTVRELSALRASAEADRTALLTRLGREDITDSVVGADAGLRQVMCGIELVAPKDTPVLILGETGAGKEVVARAIHRGSRRAAGPFLRVNCGAIPPELADSELFGHERGSFTGASMQRQGWFERADGGTLFLDEIGELLPALQVRLLRVLQDGTFERVGGQRQLRVDVRVVAATHRDLAAMVAAGRFRADLWYRINVFPLVLPALRERLEDIPAMAAHFALRAAKRLGLSPQLPTAEDLQLLRAYPWPGNVRELSAVIERAAILGNGGPLQIRTALGVDMPTVAREQVRAETPEPDQSLDDAVRRHIEAALTDCLGRIEGPFGAARRLEVNPHTLRARMRRLGIDWRRFRPAQL
ncbi:sigma-54-dependent Fis family transcriptional regulator [Thiohalocapsa marina]|uniref:Sigma-54-dependent Fis family transcriptional regulator n=1 Tax=Thiohalocapsa marina TaxID=424902 RepID=A0A5M8FCY5_9GAMM|nr:sigma 54-interacting transcriptional regulator [Thiohalocapsa marina]KAA6182529.1 sigma-54-dependent Fis family transcriptional regulator [Thiohalocapsa marina]